MDIERTVKDLRAEGLNCAQTVVAYGLRRCGGSACEAALLRAFMGFGNGLSSGRLCGCPAGAAALFGCAVPTHDAGGRKLVRGLTRALADWFEAAYGSTECAVLKKPQSGTPVPCDELILRTCEKCDELLCAAGIPAAG